MFSVITFTTFALVSVVVNSSSVNDRSDISQSLAIDQLIDRWQKIDNDYRNLDGFKRVAYLSMEEQSILFGPEMKKGDLTKYMAFRKGYFVTYTNVKHPDSSVICVNPDYSFQLYPSAKQPHQWLIKEVTKSRGPRVDEELVQKLFNRNRPPMLLLNNTPLVTVFRDKNTKIIENRKVGNKYLLSFDYLGKPTEHYPGVPPLKSGQVMVDPSLDYCPVKTVYQLISETNGQLVKFEFDFDVVKLSNGVLAPKRIVQKAQNQLISDVTSNIISTDLPDTSEFYLSHFGLPEPDWYIKQRTYQKLTWVALLLGSVILAFVAYLLSKRLSKRL